SSVRGKSNGFSSILAAVSRITIRRTTSGRSRRRLPRRAGVVVAPAAVAAHRAENEGSRYRWVNPYEEESMRRLAADTSDLPFLEPLGGLRWRFIWSRLAVVVGVSAGFYLVMHFDLVAHLESPILPF